MSVDRHRSLPKIEPKCGVRLVDTNGQVWTCTAPKDHIPRNLHDAHATWRTA